jgi:hypothetical protein
MKIERNCNGGVSDDIGKQRADRALLDGWMSGPLLIPKGETP